jgi:hypothetical protein
MHILETWLMWSSFLTLQRIKIRRKYCPHQKKKKKKRALENLKMLCILEKQIAEILF